MAVYETKLFCSKLHAECNEELASYKNVGKPSGITTNGCMV